MAARRISGALSFTGSAAASGTNKRRGSEYHGSCASSIVAPANDAASTPIVSAPVKPGTPFLRPYGAEWIASEAILACPLPGIKPHKPEPAKPKVLLPLTGTFPCNLDDHRTLVVQIVALRRNFQRSLEGIAGRLEIAQLIVNHRDVHVRARQRHFRVRAFFRADEHLVFIAPLATRAFAHNFGGSPTTFLNFSIQRAHLRVADQP